MTYDKKMYEEDTSFPRLSIKPEDAPLTEKERFIFRHGLYAWRDHIKNGYIEDARRLQARNASITELPTEVDLNMLYRMFEIRLVLKEGNHELAEEMLRAEEADIENANEENKHHFYYNMGSVYLYRYEYKTALQFYLKALELERHVYEKDAGIYINLAVCYGQLGKYALAIGTLEEACRDYKYDSTSAYRDYIEGLLGVNYVRTGQVERAKRHISKDLSELLGNNPNYFARMAHHNYGCACWMAKEYEEAIEYFDKAFRIYKNIDRDYFENMYWKVRCLIAWGKISEAQKLLSETMSLTEIDAHYQLALESLLHLISIESDESIEFIEQKTIPYFVERYEYDRVLEYCELLEGIFKRRGSDYKARALKMTTMVCNIVKEMTLGEEVVFDKKSNAC